MISTYTFFWLLMCSQPLLMCIFLVVASASMALGMISWLSTWLGYAIFLVFLGGMMIVFLYASSLSLTDKMFLSDGPMKIVAMSSIPSICLAWTTSYSLQMFWQSYPLSLLFHNSSQLVIFFLIVYLLVALFSVVKISESFKGALSKTW